MNSPDVIIGVSTSHDYNKNPLSTDTKVKMINQLQPSARILIGKDPFDIVNQLSSLGYNNLTYVVGGDYEHDSYIKRLIKYANDQLGIQINNHSISGVRDVTISATLARQAALDNDIDKFIKLCNPNEVNSEYVSLVYDAFLEIRDRCNRGQSM